VTEAAATQMVLNSTMRFFAALVAAAAAIVTVSCSPVPAEVSVHTYAMGEHVKLGHLTYQVFERQWLAQLGTGPDARVPQSRFFLVRTSITNGGGADILAKNPVLEDDGGKTYDALADGSGVPQWIGFLLQVKPADTLHGWLVFDVAPKHYKLRITEEEGDRDISAYIDIPLSFDGQASDITMPDAEKKE
jgi:hypothetical protein